MSQPDDPTFTRGAAEYIAAMQNLYGRQAWDLVETHVEHAWAACRLAGDPAWEEVREHLKASWPCPVGR